MINLLPPSYKKELKREEHWRIVLNLEIFLFAFLISLALILLAFKYSCQGLEEANQILVNSERKVIELEKERQVLLGMEGLGERAQGINQNLSGLVSFFRQQNDLTLIIQDLAGLLPKDSYLTGFSFKNQDSMVNLSGFCPDRDSLYQLKNNLEGKEGFQDLDFPSSNWLNPNNFNISFKIQK